MTEHTKAQRLADILQYKIPSMECLEEAAAELRRLDRFEKAHQVWIEKTNWVQDVSTSKELGMHRADVLKKRIDDLAALNAELVEALEFCAGTSYITDAHEIAEAALAKAEEQT